MSLWVIYTMKKGLYLIAFFMFSLLQIPSFAEANNLAPEEITGARTINTDTAKFLINKGHSLIDVRGAVDFNNGHIPGASHLPVKNEVFSPDNLRKIVAQDQAVIFYCNGIHCMGSSIATKRAIEWGWTNVFYYRDGFEGWKDAGLDVKVNSDSDNTY